MKYALAELGRNLAAGVRLALFRPVKVSDFRITLGALVALFAFVLALDIALNALQVGMPADFDGNALPRWLLGTSIVFVFAALVSIAAGQPQLALAVAVILLAAEPPLMLGAEVYRLVYERTVFASRPTPAAIWSSWGLWGALLAWACAIVARTLALVVVPRPQRFGLFATVAVVALTGASFVIEFGYAPRDWWIAQRADDDTERAASTWRVVDEDVLVAQATLLDKAVGSLAAQRPGVVDVYFVGFAPYAGQDVFMKDVRVAREVVEARFDANGRSMLLVNNPATVLDTPLATASNLRSALEAIGKRIDPEEDAVLVFLTSHGHKDHRLAVQFGPLRLAQVDPTGLKSMLDAAGIRWRIVVVSACYSGGFVTVLADPRTLVMTASAPDRTSFGCSHDSEMTFFTDALFNQALRNGEPLLPAFERARTLVGERERAEGLSPPSNPQMFVGEAMRERLALIEGSAAPSCAGEGCKRP